MGRRRQRQKARQKVTGWEMLPALKQVQVRKPQTVGDALFNLAIGLVDIGIQKKISAMQGYPIYLEGVPPEQNPAPSRETRGSRGTSPIKVAPGVEYYPPDKS